MNKQYVLIQEYPGSPTIGTKVWIQNSESMYYRSNIGDLFSKRDVENHPKYWQAILCVPIGTKFKAKGEPMVYTIDMNEDVNKVTVRWNGYGSTNYLVKQVNELFVNGDWKVIEGEVKEGDYITFLKDFDASKARQTVQVSAIQKDSSSANGWITYSNPKRNPVRGGFRWKDSKSNGYKLGVDFRLATPEEIAATKPLFTTEDGKEIYQGDSWWYVIPYRRKIAKTNKLVYKGDRPTKDKIITFSTEKLAQDYLALFKPLLTYNDIESLVGSAGKDIFKKMAIARNKW